MSKLKMKYYRLTEVSFIGGSLLAPGSFITSADLGIVKNAKGEEEYVRPGATMVEVDEAGNPVNDAEAAKLQGAAAALVEVPLNTAPTQAPGGVSLAANSLRTAPEGAADAVLAMQQDNLDKAPEPAGAITAGQPLAEAPQRRGGTK